MFTYGLFWGVGAFSVSRMMKDPPAMREAWAPSLGGDPLQQGMAAPPVSLPGEPVDGGPSCSLTAPLNNQVGCSHTLKMSLQAAM